MPTPSDHRAPAETRPLPGFAAAPVLLVATVLVAALLLLASRYGYHRDELYFRVAGRHLAWGYVDQPPFTPFVARLSAWAFGDQVVGLRVIPAVTSGVSVTVTALLARETGGGRAAQTLAALGAAGSAYLLVVGHLLATATFDLLAWLVVCWLLLRLLRTERTGWWLPIGLVVGLGLVNKYLVALLVLALLVGLLATPARRLLVSWGFVGGLVLGALVAAPVVWWQATHGWPQVTVARGIGSDDGTENRLLFVPMQVVQWSPVVFAVALVGARVLWRTGWARPMVLAYPVLCLIVLASGGKPYYALPLLSVLAAAGWQSALDGARRRGLLVAVGAFALAMSVVVALPVLPVSRVGPVGAVNAEQVEQIGWPELAGSTAAVWQRLSPEERAGAVLLAANYGEAGALDRFGPGLGLPTVYSPHMSFYEWGRPPDWRQGPVLVLAPEDAGDRLTRHFTGCREVDRLATPAGVDNEEQGALLSLCERPRQPWSQLWPQLRRYY